MPKNNLSGEQIKILTKAVDRIFTILDISQNDQELILINDSEDIIDHMVNVLHIHVNTNLYHLESDEHYRQWFNRKNNFFGGETPLEVLLNGRSKDLRDYTEGFLER